MIKVRCRMVFRGIQSYIDHQLQTIDKSMSDFKNLIPGQSVRVRVYKYIK